MRWRCQVCACVAATGQSVCGRCLTQRPWPDIAHCVAAVDYAYPWDALVARLKFHAEPAWAHTMAELLLDRPEARTLLAEADWIAPVPLTRSRLAERGYNQAWEIAKALRAAGQQRGLSVPAPLAEALLRRGDGADQHTLDRQRRWQNLQHAFQPHPAHGRRLDGRRVLLVDDVCTTGATLQMAARALRGAGASTVDALVFARTDESAGS